MRHVGLVVLVACGGDALRSGDSATSDTSEAADTGEAQGSCPYAGVYTAVEPFELELEFASDGVGCVIESTIWGLAQSEEIEPGCSLSQTVTLEPLPGDFFWGGSVSEITYCDGSTDGSPALVPSVLFEEGPETLSITIEEGWLATLPQPIVVTLTP